MITAIVYTSNTGHTEAYARMLGSETGLPVYTLSEAEEKLPADAQIFYMGWLMSGAVKGYKQAAKRYQVCGLCGVGMGATGSQLNDVKKANGLKQDLPVFTLQGGFDMAKLRGVYKLMMAAVSKTIAKSIEKKPRRTPDEDVMLDMIRHGGDHVRQENLAAVLDWLKLQV